jgi:TPP-dependent pyruvate/acetoin dehydrogenase alpha subunit
MAYAEKLLGHSTLAIAFLGDGTLGEGVIYEALNMASIWNIPILYVVENNHIAQTTPLELTLAGSVASRFQAFGISTTELDTSDVLEIQPVAKSILAEIRSQHKPQALILNTYRFGPHSKGDDTRSADYLMQIKSTRSSPYSRKTSLRRNQLKIEEQVSQGVETAIKKP